MDGQAPIMVETGNNKHNFGHPEGFCQFLKIQDFLRGQNLNFPQKCRFFLRDLIQKFINCKKNPSGWPKLQVSRRVSEI